MQKVFVRSAKPVADTAFEVIVDKDINQQCRGTALDNDYPGALILLQCPNRVKFCSLFGRVVAKHHTGQ